MRKKLTQETLDTLVRQIERIWRHFQVVRAEARAVLDPATCPTPRCN